MGMQTDVLAGHIDVSGFIIPNGRYRVKQITYQGSGAGAGAVEVFDTTTVPVSATYGRSGTLVTVTKSSHGLDTGDSVGIGFSAGSGASATDGNYVITKVDANTFTITDPNTGTVTPGTACRYVDGSGGRWLVSFSTLTSQAAAVTVLVPGEGVLAASGIYVSLTNAAFVTVFYG
jgi:hypothetical protein